MAHKVSRNPIILKIQLILITKINSPHYSYSNQQIKRDCDIWQNMKRIDKPMFVKEERAMVELRRWFMQFYDGTSNFSLVNK